MNIKLNGVLLSDIENMSYGHESEVFAFELSKFDSGFESLEEEFITGELTYIDSGMEGLFWSTVRTTKDVIKGSAKAGRNTAKFIKRNAKDLKAYLKTMFLKLQKIIKELGMQLSARFARLMKVADRYNKLGAEVHEIVNFLGTAVKDMPEINLSWHKFDAVLLKLMFDGIEDYEAYYKRVIEGTFKSEGGSKDIPTPEKVRDALNRNDKQAISNYCGICSNVIGYFNSNKELAIIIGLSGGSLSDVQKSGLVARLAKRFGTAIANVFTLGKFKDWKEARKLVNDKSTLSNVSKETKENISKNGSALTGAGSFLKEAILGQEIRKTYSTANADEFKDDMLNSGHGFLILMQSILGSQIIFKVLKSGALSIKKETDARLKEIQEIIKNGTDASEKSEKENKASDATNKNDNTDDKNKQEDKKDNQQEQVESNFDSPDKLAELYVRLMGSILARACKDYAQIITACLSTTFILVKETEGVIAAIKEQTTSTK